MACAHKRALDAGPRDVGSVDVGSVDAGRRTQDAGRVDAGRDCHALCEFASGAVTLE